MKDLHKIFYIFSIVLLFSTFTINVHGQQLTPDELLDQAVKSYRQYKDVETTDILVPTVIEVPFENEFFEYFNFAILNKKSDKLEPYFFVKEVVANQIPVLITTNQTSGEILKITDNNAKTYEDFKLPEDIRGEVQINIISSDSITSSSLRLLLDNHVALPTSVEVRAVINNTDTIVVAPRKMDSQSLQFPKTNSNKWTVNLTYAQPLRIAELRLVQEDNKKIKNQGVRFLAQPNQSYRIYFNADRNVAQNVGESGNLLNNKGVKKLQQSVSEDNPIYTEADIDGDNVSDMLDNCVNVKNSNQEDIDNNGRGDACDDFDRDGLINDIDNCINQPNRNQLDTDSDGLGDVCDEEESRITEKYQWLPWLGMALAALILLMFFVITARSVVSKK